MNQPHNTLRLSTWARLVILSLLLIGLCLALGVQARPVHATSMNTFSVSNCSNDSQLQADINTANSDNANDTITFACSGDIPLTSTLTISGSMTLDGSSQSVTLDGQEEEVLFVKGGVSLTLKALTIAKGISGVGGGIRNIGTLTISNSTFSGNSAPDGEGGGIANIGTLTISNSTFSGNTTGLLGEGGGLWNLGTASISNSTFANNSAFAGGGLLNTTAGTLSISNSTFSGNAGRFVGGIGNAGTVSINGSIVANNSGGDCAGTISDQGYNLKSGTDCGFTGTGSLQNTDPRRASALASNGGPTQTIALLPGSPAIDRIPATSCPATDQRGLTRPDNSETTCDIGAYESSYDDDLALTNLPANITVNATSPQGATVTYTPPTATDESGENPGPSVKCNPVSGSIFPIGTTKVTCTASDSDDVNSPVSQSFTVTVNDTDLGLTNLPANLTVNATSPQGATVTYTPPTVVDEDSPLPPVNCTPASGRTFAIGTTTVTCTVSDSDDTSSSVSQSFSVTVKGAAAQVSDLITTVNSFHLANSLQTALDNKLQDVLTAINGGQTATACSELTDFIGHVQSQSGKGLTTAQANQLMAAAKQVQAVLGC